MRDAKNMMSAMHKIWPLFHCASICLGHIMFPREYMRVIIMDCFIGNETLTL